MGYYNGLDPKTGSICDLSSRDYIVDRLRTWVGGDEDIEIFLNQ